MKCRQCGAEIADKALICYKCGTATTEAKFKAPPPGRMPKSVMNRAASVLALLLLVLFALYMQRMATVGAPPELRWLIVIVAAVIVVLRLVGRRAGR